MSRLQLSLVYLNFAVCLWGQLASSRPVQVRGEVSYEGGGRVDALSVELLSQGHPIGKAMIPPDGGFEFRDVPGGLYEIRIVNWQGTVVHRDFVAFHDNGPELAIKLPKSEGARPASGKVSVQSLLRPVPSKAQKEYVRAEKALAEGEVSGAVEHLQKAIEIFPDYLEAHNNLGTRYMIAGDFQRAMTEFKTAVDLDPKAAVPQSNLALTLVTLQRLDEAEEAAKKALALDSALPQARYALGLAAAGKGRCTVEVLEDLKAAGRVFPRARLAAARVMVCRGEVSKATSELRGYLELPGAQNRPLVESWIAKLEAASARR